MILRYLTLVSLLSFSGILAPNSLHAQDIEAIKSGVVRIRNTKHTDEQGTGFIVKIERDQVYIVTAAHIVRGDSTPDIYLFNRQNTSIKAEVLDREEDDLKGLALLLVRGDERVFSGLTALALGPASSLKGGEVAQVIGFPGGTALWTVTGGSIARLEGRNVLFSGAIEGGNSGGPVLFNGRVVGLVTDTSQSFAYAAQAESVAQYANGLVQDLTTIKEFPGPTGEPNPTDKYFIYFVSISDGNILVNSFNFPYGDIKVNKDSKKFTRLVHQIASQYVAKDPANDLFRIFRMNDERVIDDKSDADAISGNNMSVIVIPLKVIEQFKDDHLSFTYIKSFIDDTLIKNHRAGR